MQIFVFTKLFMVAGSRAEMSIGGMVRTRIYLVYGVQLVVVPGLSTGGITLNTSRCFIIAYYFNMPVFLIVKE